MAVLALPKTESDGAATRREAYMASLRLPTVNEGDRSSRGADSVSAAVVILRSAANTAEAAC